MVPVLWRGVRREISYRCTPVADIESCDAQTEIETTGLSTEMTTGGHVRESELLTQLSQVGTVGLSKGDDNASISATLEMIMLRWRLLNHRTGKNIVSGHLLVTAEKG